MNKRKQTPAPITDAQILVAHAEGMEAREEGKVLADNPHTARVMREAWLEGWCCVDDNARNQVEG